MKKVKLKTLAMLLFFVGIVLVSYNNVYASDASNTLTDSSTTTQIVLQAGKSYEFDNSGDIEIRISNNSDWDKIKYDYISINEDGQVSSANNTYGVLRIGNKDKFTLLVKGSDIICWCPEDIFSNIQYKEVDMPQPEQGKVSVLKNEIIKKADGKILVVSYIGNGTSNNEQINAVAKMKDASNKVLEVKGSSVSINSQSVVVAVFAFDSKYPTNNIEVCIPEKSDKAGTDSYGI